MVNIIALSCLCADVFDASGEIRPGGEALNFAASVCRYDHLNVGLMGVVGNDIYAQQILSEIDARPIDRSGVRIVPGGITASNRIYLTEAGDRYFKPDSWQGGIHNSFALDDAHIRQLGSADIVQIHHSSPAFRHILELKDTLGYRISADFNEDSRFDILSEYASKTDFFFISGAGRETTITAQLRAWSEQWEGIYIATFAENGSAAYHHGTEYRVNAKPVSEVIDTTGCGDSYQAGFIAEFTRSGDIVAAMNEGSAVASHTLSHIGGLN